MSEHNRYLEAGRIVNTHGVRGLVKTESYCDSPQVLASLRTLYRKGRDGSYIPLEVVSAFLHKGYVILELRGLSSLDDALALKGFTVYASRSDIPKGEGEVFISDLIGLPVFNAATGERIGTVRDYITGRAQNLFEIELLDAPQTQDGEPADRLRYIPSVKQFIEKIDTESGIYITPIEGLL